MFHVQYYYFLVNQAQYVYIYIYLLNSKLENEIEREKVIIYVIFATDTDGY